MTEYVGEVEYYYPRDMFIIDDGSLVFFSYEGLGANVDMDGNLIAPIEMDAEKAQQPEKAQQIQKMPLAEEVKLSDATGEEKKKRRRRRRRRKPQNKSAEGAVRTAIVPEDKNENN